MRLFDGFIISIYGDLWQLLPDTKLRKDVIQQILYTYFSRYFTQMIERTPNVHRHKIGGYVVVKASKHICKAVVAFLQSFKMSGIADDGVFEVQTAIHNGIE